MDVFQAIYERRSIRVYDSERKIAEDVIFKIVNSARYAPVMPTTDYPFRFVVINDEETRELLAMSAKEVAAMLFGGSYELFGQGHLWYLPENTRLKVAEYTTTGELWTYPREADLVLVPLCCKGAWVDVVTNITDPVDTYLQYLGMAVQCMWLTAYKYGVGSAYNGMPQLDLRRRELVATQLGLPLSWEPTGALCFGYAKEKRYYGPARTALDQVVFNEHWGVPYERIAIRQDDYDEMAFDGPDVEDVLANMNYVDSFLPGKIPEWKTEKIMDAALWGPFPENFKNWRFIVIRDKESREFLMAQASEKIHDPWLYNWAEHQHSRVDYLKNQDDKIKEIDNFLSRGLETCLADADTLVLIVTEVFNWRDQPYTSLAAGGVHMFAISTGACVQNMMVAATALDVGVHYDIWSCSDDRSNALISEYFGIPQTTWVPLGVMALGNPGEKSVDHRKRSLSSLYYEGVWGVENTRF